LKYNRQSFCNEVETFRMAHVAEGARLTVTCSPDCYHSEVESRSFMIDV